LALVGETMTVLSYADSMDILIYYKVEIPRSKKEIRAAAEHIMATKLCRCIKKLDPNNESRSIGICTKTIFSSKGLTRGKFNCKKKGSVQFNRTRKVKRGKVQRGRKL